MAIDPVQIRNLKLDSISPEDQADLDAVILEFTSKLNEVIRVMNANHP